MVYKIAGRTAAAIAVSIEQNLHDGRLRPSATLPTVRDLAATLGVSPTTVAAAYRLLRTRGLLSGHGRRGTRLNSQPTSPESSPSTILADGLIDLATGNPDPAMLPALDRGLRTLDAEPRLYGEPPHLSGLMTFVRGELEADGIAARSVTIVSGALDGIERVLREHLRPGDHVAIEDPVFPGVRDLLVATGYVPVPFAIDDTGPVVEAFERALRQHCRAAIITPRAQNPTGAALDAARASDLRRLLKHHLDVLVIENDPAGPVSGCPAMTVCDPGRDKWAIVRSTSKFLGPDLRVAFVAGDALTIARVEGRHALTTRWVSHVLQQIVLALWSDPAGGRLLARASELYRQRRLALLSALGASSIPAHGSSGLNVWIPVRDEAHVVHALADRGWAVAAGERFRQHTPPAIRVTIASLQPADAARLAESLAEVLRPGQRGSA